jgi:uncharacterized delta-60 repeat protein
VLALPVAAGSAGRLGESAGIPIRPDGKVVVAIPGAVYKKGARRPTSMFIIARFTRAGRLDRAFGAGGRVASLIRKRSLASAAVLQPDGKIVAAGFACVSDCEKETADYRFALARYKANGALDPGFGSGGHVTTAMDPRLRAGRLVLQPDGKIVGGGDITLARYNPDGSLDPSFGSGGMVTVGSLDDLALQPNGGIVALTSAWPDSYLARYRSDGSLDENFGEDGSLRTPFSANGIATQSDDKILVAGGTGCGDGVSDVFAVARYTTDGSLDPDFGTGGIVKTPFFPCGQPADYRYGANALTVAVEPDGRIVAAGGTLPNAIEGYRGAFALARYQADGSLDTSFGEDGTVRTALPFSADPEKAQPTGDIVESLGVQSNGKIVVQGESNFFGPHGEGYAWDLARYDPNGTLDDSFGDLGGALALRLRPLCRVPRVARLPLPQARRKLARWHCSTGRITQRFSSRVHRGRVIRQRPVPKTLARKVKLVVSKGRHQR